MTKISTLQAISAGVVKNIIADNITVGESPVYLGVWPREITNQESVETYMIRAVTTDVFLVLGRNNTLMPVPVSSGQTAVKLFADTEYVIPLDPSVDTLGFIASGASQNVEVYIRGMQVR